MKGAQQDTTHVAK